MTAITSGMTREERYTRRRRRYELGGAGVGALCGAAVGGIAAGVPGAAFGAIVGVAMGGATAWAAHSRVEDDANRDSQLDIEIGVTSSELGVPELEHPPAKIGAFSKEASGVSSSTETREASGPILRPPD